ncbi:MAG: ACT domain-containing protein [Peptococcaceae bacterium]|jgi:hypothetical protein|nr:ACT domain-containing protein [Peptococcaceae bacterium]
MSVNQISIFVPNKAGWLGKVSRLLGDHGVNIRALSIADTTDFGILRLIVSDPARTGSVLREAGLTATITEVVAVAVEDRPGGLATALRALEDKGIGIEYLYGFVVQKEGDQALVVLRVEDVTAAEGALAGAGVRVLGGDEVYRL